MTPARVTPERARALLVDLDLESVPPYEKLPTSGKLFEVRDKERNLVADLLAEREAALLTAAPALAKLVASLRYEYAVQVEMSDGEWHFTDDEFYPFGTPEPRHAEWQTKTGAEELYASFVEDDGPKHIRIVRRLVSESEVAE